MPDDETTPVPVRCEANGEQPEIVVLRETLSAQQAADLIGVSRHHPGLHSAPMGLISRIAKAVERKLDGPPQPPPHEWPADQAWARILRSEQNPGSSFRSASRQDAPPSMFDDLINKTTGVAYGFELEVHRPGRSTYELARRTRVPTKVEGTLFLKAHKIPAGTEVPLRVTGPNEEDFELDWDAYLTIPHQRDRAYHLELHESYATSRVESPGE